MRGNDDYHHNTGKEGGKIKLDKLPLPTYHINITGVRCMGKQTKSSATDTSTPTPKAKHPRYEERNAAYRAAKAIAGRKPKPIDYDLLERLCNIQCTNEEIAAGLDIGVNTVTRLLQSDEHFGEVYNKGKANGRMSVRRMQFKAAQEGSIGMMIWLGKQVLGQSDKSEVGEIGTFTSWADLVRKAQATEKEGA